MASIFTYQEEPHRVHSPWSTPGSSTPQIAINGKADGSRSRNSTNVTRLEPEKHDGPIEYKLHLLLRSRRAFTYTSTRASSWGVHLTAESSLGTRSASESSLSKTPLVPYQPSTQTRQARLQQLTTQLLWRLQQSSPFHSSSNASLVLPVLPEATPRLGVPDRPSKLLPGLEESQGALYEIGVADDGTLIGLVEEELEESLTNLRAMAASLGCVVDIHRRVVVGDCEWTEPAHLSSEVMLTKTGSLWVAEVLVRPDNKVVQVIPSSNPDAVVPLSLESQPTLSLDLREDVVKKTQLRVAITGASGAGKSSLLGTLSTSALDNGRGKSRISLLKHRHEVASGVTSSVAQELLGYRASADGRHIVVNYASGDVSSWPDIHNLADRLVFLSDSPGLPRYAKSAFRAQVSWKPSVTIVCIAANEDDDAQQRFARNQAVQQSGELVLDPDISMAHLELCTKLDKPFIVCITKLDIATKSGLRSVLSKVLSQLKAAGKRPMLLNSINSQTVVKDENDIISDLGDLVLHESIMMSDLFNSLKADHFGTIVPILMTSAVTGVGIGKIHALLRGLSLNETDRDDSLRSNSPTPVLFRTDEVFAIPPSKVYSGQENVNFADTGVVLCGILDSGTISLGDELILGPFTADQDSDDTTLLSLRRASSHGSRPAAQAMSRSISEMFSKSLQLHCPQPSMSHSSDPVVLKVKVVSLRNLRLPVLSMHAGQTGTVGIQLIDASSTVKSLSRARKGMVLMSLSTDLTATITFMAAFPASDFGGSTAPPLILGGHAIAYVNTIRAVVKVVAVALDEHQPSGHDVENGKGSPTNDVFSFEDDGSEAEQTRTETQDLNITFKFVSTIEFVEVGDQVVIVPNLTSAGPVTGPVSGSTVPGLSGFVGRISEIHS